MASFFFNGVKHTQDETCLPLDLTLDNPVLKQLFPGFKQARKLHSTATITTAQDYFNFMFYVTPYTVPELPSKHTRWASSCRHVIHPTNQKTVGLCPTCEARMYISYLHVIAKAWDKYGGPFGTTTERGLRSLITKVWTKERASLANLLIQWKDLAAKEVAWVLVSDEERDWVRQSNTTAKALIVAALEMTYPANATPKPLTSTPRKTPNLQQKKQVTFAPLSAHIPRPRAAYARSSTSYTPGRHACPSPSGWQNTSFMTNSWGYTLAQHKFFICETNKQLSRKELPSFQHKGLGIFPETYTLAGEVPKVFNFIHATIASKKDGVERWKKETRESDALILFRNKGTGKFYKFAAVKLEVWTEGAELMRNPGLVNYNGAWTCMRALGFR